MTSGFNPLNDKQRKTLNELLNGLTTEQWYWLNGYIEGRLSGNTGKMNVSPVATVETNAIARLTILYGSETGHSQELAEKLAEKAANKNIDTKVFNMYDYDITRLEVEENLAIIVSTHGEGDPPDMAAGFYRFITGENAPALQHLNYSVLALGDKSYKNFCKTGEDIDLAVKKCGAFRITPMIKCDVEYELNADIWMNNLLLNIVPSSETLKIKEKQNDPVDAEYSKKNPFMATVLDKVELTGEGSDKKVYHIELSLEGSGLSYEPGDSLGIYTKNPDLLVNLILQKTGFDPEQKITTFLGETTVREALLHHFEITVLNFDTIQKYFEKTQNEELEKLLDDDDWVDDYLYGNDLFDLLEDFPYTWSAEGLFETLRHLPPRLYSVSSSMDMVGQQVHVVVSEVSYLRKNRLRKGACSSHLSNNIEIGDQLPVYIEKNPYFKLPLNGEKIIMVGAGTGIAPYRAFLQQREIEKKAGNTWLFFGDRKSETNFLYRDELENWKKSSHLEKLETAFSRDKEEKVYVQHKMIENQKELYQWIEDGAYLYVCGAMKTMAKDVNKTLVEIIKTQGGMSMDKAGEFLKRLKREKRFQQDVY